MDGILLLVTGKTARNLERTLNMPASKVSCTKADIQKVPGIWEKMIRKNLKTMIVNACDWRW